MIDFFDMVMRTTSLYQRGTNGGRSLLAAVPFLLAAVLPGASARQPMDLTSATRTLEMQWNRDLLNSSRVEQVTALMARENELAQQATDDSFIERIKKALPSLDQFGSSLKYGTFAAVSPEGPEVIRLIRAVPMLTGKERSDTLDKLVRFSRAAVPEAQNFTGFVYQYGLFGAARDPRRAREFYRAAAARRYQPALFNLANMAYLGIGQAPDPEMARELVHQAAVLGAESSHRVCGLASFIEYRRADRAAALRLGASCFSPLAHIPNAAYNDQLPLTRRIKMLRDSIGTGTTDGYRWLEEITQHAGPDREHLYCKYRLINLLRLQASRMDVNALARTCYERGAPGADRAKADTAVQAIASFATADVRTLEQSRRSNPFRYTGSIPYLPFGQRDVDLFEPVMKEAK